MNIYPFLRVLPRANSQFPALADCPLEFESLLIRPDPDSRPLNRCRPVTVTPSPANLPSLPHIFLTLSLPFFTFFNHSSLSFFTF